MTDDVRLLPEYVTVLRDMARDPETAPLVRAAVAAAGSAEITEQILPMPTVGDRLRPVHRRRASTACRVHQEGSLRLRGLDPSQRCRALRSRPSA